MSPPNTEGGGLDYLFSGPVLEKMGTKEARINAATKRALEELDSINTLQEFIQICQEQKRKRGW